jgi:hypothetical protein
VTRFQDFSVLIANFRQRLADFKPYSAMMNEKTFVVLDEFREMANSSAHAVDANVSPDFFKQKKADINNLIELLQSVKSKIK